jgi:DNA-binding transcriptional ArsR family regulator
LKRGPSLSPSPSPLVPRRPSPASALSDDKATQLAEIFRLIGEPNRLRLVFACLDGPVAAGDLAESLALSPSLVSHHLRLLKAARLLASRRHGRQIFYQAADQHIRSVLKDMAAHVEEPEEES